MMSCCRKTYSSDMTEAGLINCIIITSGKKLIPYFDLAYVNEDTTAAAYNTEEQLMAQQLI